MAENNKIVLSIDSSSTNSGVALFLNGELKEYTEIKHKATSTLPNNAIDLQQNRMQDVVDKLIFKYAQDTESIESIAIVVEIPMGSYTNNTTFGRLQFYAGMWLGKITALLTAMPGLMAKTHYVQMNGGILSRYFNFDKIQDTKVQSINTVKKLYGVDLNDYKIPKYNQDGSIRRLKNNDVIYDKKPKHNAADAILLGHIYINKK